MHFRTSIGSFRLALLATLGATAGTACGGTVTDASAASGGGAAGAGGASVGGRSAGGTASGGASAGGRAAGGRSSGGTASGGRAAGGTASGGTASGGASTGGWSAGGGSSGGTSTGGGSAGGAGGVPSEACLYPVPIVSSVTKAGPSGGFVQCEGGQVQRPTVSECWSNVGPADAGVTIPNGPDGSVSVACRRNGDCTAAPHGYCSRAVQFGFGGAPSFSCVYGCVNDSECGAGRICLCGEPVGTCVAASCRSNADCPGGAPCRETWTLGVCSAPIYEFRCGPLCRVDGDCAGGSFAGRCGTDGNCQPLAVCGRPFLVEGEARLARASRRGDWAFGVLPDVTGLSDGARRALAEHYTAIGLMEHASIAAFARFTLELLSLGAPPELVRLSTDALADETRHAQECFGLATAYGGVEVGPGPLALDQALSAGSVAARVRTAFLEACIGETLAALEVGEASLRATDPVVATLLRRIAEDEARHAALGFRFVKWALEAMSEPDGRAVESDLLAAFSAELASPSASAGSSGPDEAVLAAHGVLPADVRSALRQVAMREVLLPCVRALLPGADARALAA
jgi:hypothetical protein